MAYPYTSVFSVNFFVWKLSGAMYLEQGGTAAMNAMKQT
jgi:hypothetical protein